MEIDSSLKNYNPSLYDERERILFGCSMNWRDLHTIDFENVTVQGIATLIELDLLNSNSVCYNSPTVAEYIKFMKQYPGFTAHGFATNPDEYNPIIIIEGLAYKGVYDKEVLLAFIKLCKEADVLEMDEKYLYCWFD